MITNLHRKRGRPKKIKPRTIEDVKQELNRLMDIPIDYEKLLNEPRITKDNSTPIDHAAKRVCPDMDELQQRLNAKRNEQIATTLFSFNQEYISTEQINDHLLNNYAQTSSDAVLYATKFHEITEQIRALFYEYSSLKRSDSEKITLEQLQSEYENRIDTEEEDFAEEDSSEADQKVLNQNLKRKLPIEEFDKKGLELLDKNSKQILINNEEKIFAEGMTYQQQIFIVYELLNPKISLSKIGILFGVTRGTIGNHVLRFKKAKHAAGRPHILSHDEVNMTIAFIYESFSRNKPRSKLIPSII